MMFYLIHEWEVSLVLLNYHTVFHSFELSFKQDLLDVPFSWHSQLTPGFTLDVSVVICNRYSTNMARGLAAETGGCLPPVDSGAKGIVCDFHHAQCSRVNNVGASLGSVPAAILGWQQLPGLFCQGLAEGNNAMWDWSYLLLFLFVVKIYPLTKVILLGINHVSVIEFVLYETKKKKLQVH